MVPYAKVKGEIICKECHEVFRKLFRMQAKESNNPCGTAQGNIWYFFEYENGSQGGHL
jgi:hypothetical protein